MDTTQFARFAPVIRTLTDTDLKTPSVLRERLRIANEGTIEVCYAPFEHINDQARVVIVGITPGMTQMVNALREARNQLQLDASPTVALAAAKRTGAFSGTMRPNLVGLLDCVGVNRMVGLTSCDDLFGRASHLLQTASVLRNPVFIAGQNYNGTPNMLNSSFLRDQLLQGFANDMLGFRTALFVPLGDKVSEALYFVAEQGLLNRHQILDGLPHPSGANAERIAYFLGRKSSADLSAKTNAKKLDSAREAMRQKIAAAYP